MWRNYRGIGLLLFLLLVLFGCGTAAVQPGGHHDQSEPIHSQSQTPPPLELKIGDDTIRTFRGGYSWSYYVPEEEAMAGIEADSNSPHESVNVEMARKVDRNADVELIFGETPSSYRVFIWEEAGNQKPIPAKIDLINYVGKNIFEIRAHWEQGNASYVFALDVE